MSMSAWCDVQGRVQALTLACPNPRTVSSRCSATCQDRTIWSVQDEPWRAGARKLVRRPTAEGRRGALAEEAAHEGRRKTDP